MGFDKNDPEEPLIHPARRTTRVNFWVVIGVLILLLASGLYMVHIRRHPIATQNNAARSLGYKP